MKIGIYTLFRSNYGAVLQAYSLQRTIREHFPDDEVMMVDFKTNHHKSLEGVFIKYSKNKLLNAIWQFCILVRYRQFKKKVKSFTEFHKNEFNYTSLYTSVQQVLQDPPKVDVHISGSDQVFNPKNNYRDVYFLGFDKKNARKVAYAPSFGISEFTEEQKSYIKRKLIDFDNLSCRESNGAAFMSELLGKAIPHVLDPVFLTPVECWRKISVSPNIKEKYVFIYGLKDVRTLIKFAQKTYKNHKIVALIPNDLRFYRGCKQVYYAGPREFLGLIENAEAVVTDSFHGTAFSIIFQKRFHTIITRQAVSSRIISLLTLLGLNDHIVTNISAPCQSQSIDTACYSVLDNWIASSKQYLFSTINQEG